MKIKGYIADVPYSFSFYKEMQPVWLTTIAMFQGYTAPNVNKEFRYCELGCGLGINLIVAAICHPKSWFVGIDVNHEHIKKAKELATKLSLTNIEFIEMDFQKFVELNEVKFDFIVCHGIWSWISKETQSTILNCVSNHLDRKGIFYLHYMCHPGASKMQSIQKMLHNTAKLSSGSSVEQMNVAIAKLKQLLSAGMFHDSPAFEKHLKKLTTRELNYLAHDFLSDHWEPQHSSDIHEQMSKYKMSYIGSANVFDNVDELSIPGNIQAVLDKISNNSFDEQIKDLAREQHQRMDLFQYNHSPLSVKVNNQMVKEFSFFSVNSDYGNGRCFHTKIGEINAPMDYVKPFLSLGENVVTVSEIAKEKVFHGQPNLLFQMLQMLMWNGDVYPEFDRSEISYFQVATLSEYLGVTLLPFKSLTKSNQSNFGEVY